jgi:endonuclease/exonuclease/phosphatase family metal-dependent hydrolase
MIRVGTFNLNNLFDRFNFHAAVIASPRVRATYRWRLDAGRDLLPPPEDGPLTDEEGAVLIEGEAPVRIELSPQGRVVRPKPTRHLEALLARTDRLNADVLAVQEVENIAALREFNSRLDAPYRSVALIEGNDPRFIDVGVLSRLPIGGAISHRWVPDPTDPNRFLFSRDVMAVEILNHGRTTVMFTLWVGHLKSKFVDPRITDPAEITAANQRNDARRTRQAQAMHDIIDGHHSANDPFVVCGDFNDHPGSAALSPLLQGNLNIRDVFHGGVQIDFERPEGEGPRISNPQDQPADENWTHRLSVSSGPDVYERFDQLLLSPSLQPGQTGARIQRRTHWGKNNAGTDHDPLFVDLNLNP